MVRIAVNFCLKGNILVECKKEDLTEQQFNIATKHTVMLSQKMQNTFRLPQKLKIGITKFPTRNQKAELKF